MTRVQPRHHTSVPMLTAARAEAPAGAREVPFSETLGKASSSNPFSFTAIDANGDGRGWNSTTHSTSYSACMGPNTDAFQTADDWLVSPPLHLLAGKTYELNVELCGSTTAVKTADFAIFMGTEAAAASLTRELAAKATYKGGSTYTKVTKDITVDADGYYYIGIHCTTDKAVNTISRAKNFSIAEVVPKVDAPAAGTITYEVTTPKTDMKVQASYTVPTLTQSGAQLTEVSKVEIFNWMYPSEKTVVDNPAPGSTLTATLNLMAGPNNRIRAVAYTGETAGDMAETANFFAGPDCPLAPTNVKATLSDDYKKVTLTWDAVGADGENGGYVEPDKVKYYIFDAFGSWSDPAIAEDVSSPYVLDYSAVKEQDFVAFQVTAGYGENYSLEGVSNVAVVGTCDALPWHESFTDCYYSAPWMQDLSGKGNVMASLWYDNDLQTNTDAPEGTEPEYMHPHDLDNGFMLMLPSAKDDCFGINSVKIDISGAAHPVFEFFYQGQGSRLEALVAREGGDFETARDIDLKTDATDGWTLCRVDLAPYKTAKYIRVGVRMTAIHNDDEHTWSVPLDNIRVIDLQDVDLRIAYVNIDKLVAGQESTVTFATENMGTADGGDALAELLKDDKAVVSETLPGIKAGEVRSFEAKFTPSVLDNDPVTITGRITAAGDKYSGNNQVGPTLATVEQSDLPEAAELTATKPGDNQVALSWQAPSIEAFTTANTIDEDFENPDLYDFAAVEWGGWKFDSQDQGSGCTILKDYNNPYRGMNIGFQVFNYRLAGLPDNQLDDARPHSGDRMLYSVCTYAGDVDNWAISPRLSGEAQTIKFWAKSFTIAYPESFSVLYSTTDNKTASFTQSVAVANYPDDDRVPEDWTEYSAQLPEGAQYFAIQHNTVYDGYILYVDDVTYQAAAAYPSDLAITGYNVWRDGELLCSPEGTAHTDRPGADGNYEYRVSVKYNYGESHACPGAKVDFSYDAVAELAAEGISVSTDAEGIIIGGADGHDIMVATPDGRIVYRGAARGEIHIPAATGVYVVGIGSTVTKAVVR